MASLRILIGACALMTMVQAAPAPVADVTVTNVVTKTQYTTLNCVKTVWLPQEQAPTTTKSSQGPFTTLLQSMYYATPVWRTTTRSVRPLPSSPTTAVYVPPTTYSPVPTTVITTSAYVAPAPVTTASSVVVTTAPVEEAPAPATTPATTPAATPATTPATTPSTAAATQAAATANTPNSGAVVQASSSNNCASSSSACEGDITHYDGGLGACGWDVNTESDMAIALPHDFMGTQSNGNPYCGRAITIKNPNTGATFQAKVGDKCMGCTGRAIDLTNVLFKAVTDGTGDGRESGYQWWFN